MNEANIRRLDSPPALDMPVTGILIDGSITYASRLADHAELAFTIPTPSGESPVIYLLRHRGVPFYYVRFHGVDFTTASGNVQVGFSRTWYAINALRIRDIISGAAAGSTSLDIVPGDVVIMRDFIDFSTHRPRSILTEIWEKPPWVGAQFDPPLCPELAGILSNVAKSYDLGRVFDAGTLGQFEGHRFESPSEIRMANSAGAHIVAHHQASEAIYARELGLHYGALNYITNYGAGLVPSEDAFVGPAKAEIGYKRSTELMMEAIARAAERTPTCRVCLQPEDRPTPDRPHEVQPKPTYR